MGKLQWVSILMSREGPPFSLGGSTPCEESVLHCCCCRFVRSLSGSTVCTTHTHSGQGAITDWKSYSPFSYNSVHIYDCYNVNNLYHHPHSLNLETLPLSVSLSLFHFTIITHCQPYYTQLIPNIPSHSYQLHPSRYINTLQYTAH